MCKQGSRARITGRSPGVGIDIRLRGGLRYCRSSSLNVQPEEAILEKVTLLTEAACIGAKIG